MIIILEGPDGSGKTTLFKALAKARQYKDTYIDRMFPSDIIYATKYSRGYKQMNDLITSMNSFHTWMKPYYVFVNADSVDMFKSLQDKSETPDYQEIVKDRQTYELFYNDFNYPNKMQIHRSGKTIDYCVKQIIKQIEKYEKGLY
jgi:ATPase subunit of ABC transporter with duplicated ATPase domains